MTDTTRDVESATPNAGKHLGWALVLICVAQLMVVLDGTIANIAIPFISKDLEIDPANQTWIVTGYALAFGGLLLLGGRLGDLYGRRRLFMTGLILFAVASGVGGLATNETMLIASRALQGAGAAMAAPAALALITTTFPAGPSRNRAFAVYAAMSGVGAAVGLILGGWLTGLDPELGWRLTFLINTPIGLGAAFLAPRFLAESDSHPGEMDFPGAVTGTLGLVGVVYGITRAGEDGWGDTWTIASLVAGVALLVAFGLVESRVAHPLLPFRVFLNRTRASSFVAMFLAPAAMFAMFYFLSQYIQLVMGYTPLRAGVAFLPFCLGIMAAAAIGSNLINRVDARVLAGIGTLMAAGGLFGFSRLPYDDTFPLAQVEANYWTDLLPFILVMSFGMGMTFIPLTLTAVHHLLAEDSGIGSGVLNTMQQVGGALGLSILATVFTTIYNNRTDDVAAAAAAGQNPGDPSAIGAQIFTEGATNAFLVGSLMMLAASAVVWAFLNVKHTELATDGPEGVHVG